MQQVDYDAIKERIKPGDMIVFSGRKRFERLIRLVTRSIISHVGVVCRTGKSVDVMESVGLKQNRKGGGEGGGVQCRQLAKLVESYDGLMWWLPLSESSRSRFDLEKFTQFLKLAEGKQYDIPQAICAVLDVIDDNPFFNLSTYSQRDFSKFFCSELAAAALQAAGVITQLNPSEVTPANLCAFNLYAEDYFQIRGRRKELDDFNFLSAENFGLPKPSTRTIRD
ncbi:MAG: hypothetical protein PHO37_07015 [Kiritimatiellae bacterium]|nr:hypothetical protein [Kiritimatiellia bacterium]